MNSAKEQSKSLKIINNKTTYNELTTTCPCCNSSNELSASFCEECGHSLRIQDNCQKCGVAAREDADICEACGEWLLKGQCMYCYFPISENETYCGECGNPVGGLICPECHRLSHYDFCSNCHIPLSHQAKEMTALNAHDPAFQELANLLEEMAENIQSTQTSHSELPQIGIVISTKLTDTKRTDELLRMKVYREGLPNQGKGSSSLQAINIFSNDQKARINNLDSEILQEEERVQLEKERKRQEEERRRMEEEKKRREEEERLKQEEARKREEERKLQDQINAVMYKVSNKKFSSNQEARRFFMNMISGLSEDVANKIVNNRLKWRCFAYDCVHSSPSECGDPSKGGVWLLQ